MTKLKSTHNINVVILAAGYGSRLGLEKPKCIVEINGKTILSRFVDTLSSIVENFNIIIIGGYKIDLIYKEVCKINNGNINVVFNPFYKYTSIVGSCWVAMREIKNPTVLRLDGDLIFMNPDSLKEFINKPETTFGRMVCGTSKDNTIFFDVDDEYRVKEIKTSDSYTGDKERVPIELYHNNDFIKVTGSSEYFIKPGFYNFQAINSAITRKVVSLPETYLLEDVYELDTIEDYITIQELEKSNV